MTPQNKKIEVMWITLVFGVLFSLVGVIYANLNDKISTKASKDKVDALCTDVQYIRQGVDELRRMHMPGMPEYRRLHDAIRARGDADDE